MKTLSVILIILSLCSIACNQRKSNNTMHQKVDTSIIVPLAQKNDKPIVLNRPPIDSDVDSFMTCRTKESFYNLDKRYDMADKTNELLFYAIVAADKFNISHAYYNISGSLTNYFSYMSISIHSKEIATHYLLKGSKKGDKACTEVYEAIDQHIKKELQKLFLPENDKGNSIVAYKAKSLMGNIDDYNQLKNHLIEKKPEELLYYSYIMADRYDYEPARKDIIDVMEKGYKKYGLGKMGQDAKYFCSFFQD